MSLQYIADFDSAEAHGDEVWAVKWLPQGAVLSASADGTLRAWHAASGVAIGEPIQVSTSPGTGIASLSVNAAGDRALTTSLDASVALWDLSGLAHAVEEATTTLREQEKQRNEAARENGQSSNGSQAAVPPDLTRVGQSPIRLLCRKDDVAGSTFGEDSKSSKAYYSVLHPTKPIFASTGINAGVYLYSAEPETFGEAKQAFCVPGKTGAAPSTSSSKAPASRFGIVMSFGRDGQLIALGTNRETFVFSTSTGALLLTLADHADKNRSLAFSTTPSGASSHLYVGADDQIITIHDVLASSEASGQEARSGTTTGAPVGSTVGHLQGHSAWITGVEPAGDGRILASCSTDGAVKLWDLATTPKACVMTATSERGGSLWGLSWKPVSAGAMSNSTSNVARSDAKAEEEDDKDVVNGHSVVAKMPRSTALVTAGSDGKLRFYRSAGAAQI